MTVGLAAYGTTAGKAVLEALGGVEACGSGEIGGFGVFAAITESGKLIRAETQRDGLIALRAGLESRGSLVAAEAAVVAAVISSGPDRPEPLTQFLAVDPAVGLVTGHRLPNLRGHDGVAVNRAVLAAVKSGETPSRALNTVLGENPEIDAGMIMATRDGVFCANSARVRRRSDCGAELFQDARGFGAACLHNSILPVAGLAQLAVGIARECLTVPFVTLGILTLRSGTKIRQGVRDRVYVDENGVILLVETANPRLQESPEFAFSAIYPGSEIVRGDSLIGTTESELRLHVGGGRITGPDEPAEILFRLVKE